VRSLLLGAGFALFFALFVTPAFIRLFERIGWGQFIRDDGPQSHHTKRGTPTMGGIIIVVGAVLGYFFGHAIDNSAVCKRPACYFHDGRYGSRRLHRRFHQDA
jgi:phospho-N-acetylmuramoyl-pentapeptide-transferase